MDIKLKLSTLPKAFSTTAARNFAVSFNNSFTMIAQQQQKHRG